MSDQTQIGGDQVKSGDPKGHKCEYRHANDEDREATHALPIMRRVKGGRAGAQVATGMYAYCCDEHLKLCEEQNPVRSPLRK